jgi:hypothetical protein
MSVYAKMRERELDRLIDDARSGTLTGACCSGCDDPWCDGVRLGEDEKQLLANLADEIEAQRNEIRHLQGEMRQIVD